MVVHFLLLIFTDAQWYSLCAQVTETREQALAKSTRRNLRTHLRAYLLFCIYFQIPPFPVLEQPLSCFIQVLINSFKSPGAVQNYAHGLQTVCKFLNQPCPDLSQFLFAYLFKGSSRVLQHMPNRAQPLTPLILTQLFYLIDHTDSYFAAWWAALTTGFFSFARISNLLPRSHNTKHPIQHLLRSNIQVHPQCTIINFTHSKTNQNGDRVLAIPLSPISSVICPVWALNNMFSINVAPTWAPAFSFTHNNILLTLTQHSFISMLRQLLSLLNLDPAQFSGHSMRRGGATHAFDSGVPAEMIQVHGDWRSDSYLTYLHLSDIQRLQVTSLMGQNIIS